MVNDISVSCVIACPWKKLSIKKNPFRTKINIKPLFSAYELCSKFNIPYYEFDHDSIKCIDLLKKIKPKIGIIAGARILKKNIIDLFKIGIINFHPGDIPKIRGLNSSLRAIKLNQPQIVTGHLIDKNIDAGLILCKEKINIETDDTIFDINEKLYNKQINMIKKSVKLALNKKFIKVTLSDEYSSNLPFRSFTEFQKYFKKYNK